MSAMLRLNRLSQARKPRTFIDCCNVILLEVIFTIETAAYHGFRTASMEDVAVTCAVGH